MATAATLFRRTEPVASIPALPGWPLLGSLAQFRRDPLALFEQAALLGPIVRLSLGNIPIYAICDADLAREMLVERAELFGKSAGLKILRPVIGDGLLSADAEPHKRHRKLLAPAFAPKRLAAYGDVMVAETEAQVARWADAGASGKPVDLSHEMMEMTLAIAGKTLFSAEVRNDAAAIGEGLELGMTSMKDSLRLPLPVPYSWPLPRNVKMKRAVELIDGVVYRLIAEGRARGIDRGDVLSMLLLAVDEDGGFTDKQVRDEAVTLLLAGHETTANALTWTWYELGRHPAVLAKLVEEVDRVLATRRATTDDLPALPYVAAVIDEAMRLHPPAYQIGRQALADVQIGGHTLPKDSIAIANILGQHRRADYFPAPLVFRPERMLPDEKKPRPRHYYVPFGAGPRVCIGQHFALMEAQLALATMVQRAKISVQPSRVEPEPLVTLRPRGGMPARVQVR